MSASSLVLFGSALLMGGCAKNASDIQATYVSPMLYENWSCRFSHDLRRLDENRHLLAPHRRRCRATRHAWQEGHVPATSRGSGCTPKQRRTSTALSSS